MASVTIILLLIHNENQLSLKTRLKVYCQCPSSESCLVSRTEDALKRLSSNLFGTLFKEYLRFHVTSKLQSRDHRRKVACMSGFCRIDSGDCMQELYNLIPLSLIVLRSTRTSEKLHLMLNIWLNIHSHEALGFIPSRVISAYSAYFFFFIKN